MPPMAKRYLLGLGLFAGSFALAPAQTVDAGQIASMRQDILLLNQRVGELNMNLEQIGRDNAALQAKTNQTFVTLDQLNRSIADINRAMQGALAEQKREVLNQVAGELEHLARQTQAAIDALAKNDAARAAPAPAPASTAAFSDDFPKEGVNYTVQTGDTLAVIARKHNARQQDIINANKIADPSKIRVGQALFIPQGK